MGYTVLIPARLASSRLPNKPLADLEGVPMVVRVAQRVRSGVAPSTRVVVAGDSPSIIQACQDHGIEAVLTREDHPSGSVRWAEASELLARDYDEIVVNVQGDEPLIDPALV
ncbi:MAG: NTP transferase domain-containing protein, partial [Rhodoferax sp.]